MRFGSRPPVVSYANTKRLPGGFKKKKRRYQELEEKIANGEALIVDEEQEMKDLAEWFTKPKHLPDILDGPSISYDPNLDFECDLGENASE